MRLLAVLLLHLVLLDWHSHLNLLLLPRRSRFVLAFHWIEILVLLLLFKSLAVVLIGNVKLLSRIYFISKSRVKCSETLLVDVMDESNLHN